ncbi:MAG: OmpA family protein [Vampirovibrio sp.]|nr:OmpA family protein [Vampirovibrio sp.]
MMMARKKKHPEHENLERWLVSYADFITLLFATFTALYAIATAKLTDPSEYSKSITEVFKQQDTLLKGIASIFDGHGSPAKENPAVKETGRGSGVIGSYESLTFKPGEVKALESLVDELQSVVEDLNKDVEVVNAETFSETGKNGDDTGETTGVAKTAYELSNDESDSLKKAGGVPLKGVEVTLQERGVKVSLDSRLLFDAGSAQLNTRGVRFLDAVASRLRSHLLYHLLHIEGHTDSQPLRNHPVYPSNWELSSARASVVVRHLINVQRFSPREMAAVGYADTRPVAINTTADGRAKNRRIDIILFSKAVGNVIDPSLQKGKSTLLLPSSIKPKLQVVPPKPVVHEQAPALRKHTTKLHQPIKLVDPVKPVTENPSGFVPVKEGTVVEISSADNQESAWVATRSE